MSRYQNASHRARRLPSGPADTCHADGVPGSGVYPMTTAAVRPTRSTPIRVTRNGSATARSASPSDARGTEVRAPAVLSSIDMQSVVRIERPSSRAVVLGALLGTRLPVLLIGAIAVRSEEHTSE